MHIFSPINSFSTHTYIHTHIFIASAFNYFKKLMHLLFIDCIGCSLIFNYWTITLSHQNNKRVEKKKIEGKKDDSKKFCGFCRWCNAYEIESEPMHRMICLKPLPSHFHLVFSCLQWIIKKLQKFHKNKLWLWSTIIIIIGKYYYMKYGVYIFIRPLNYALYFQWFPFFQFSDSIPENSIPGYCWNIAKCPRFSMDLWIFQTHRTLHTQQNPNAAFGSCAFHFSLSGTSNHCSNSITYLFEEAFAEYKVNINIAVAIVYYEKGTWLIAWEMVQNAHKSLTWYKEYIVPISNLNVKREYKYRQHFTLLYCIIAHSCTLPVEWTLCIVHTSSSFNCRCIPLRSGYIGSSHFTFHPLWMYVYISINADDNSATGTRLYVFKWSNEIGV